MTVECLERLSPVVVGVRRLTLSDFRGYSSLRLDVDLRPVVLTGANGAGKTNLIEATSFLAPGRGLRQARLSEVVRFGALGGWAVAATVATAVGLVDIGTGVSGGGEDENTQETLGKPDKREKRLLRVDGVTVRRQALLAEMMAMVWLTPAMDRLFQESASGRRRFLDRMVLGFDPGHASRAAAYEHAMRERSRLLREGHPDPAWLDVLERTMAEKGVAVAAARRELVMRLAVASAAGGAFPRAVLGLTGDVDSLLAEGRPALEVEDRLRHVLRCGRAVDQASGGASSGPHRSDMTVLHAAKGRPAAACSTGEQKALLISLVLAAAREMTAVHGRTPVLLLDEVVAHLDETRRRALYDELCALGLQAWLTGTDQSQFAALAGRAQFFCVHDATVTPQPSM